jgi:hypothetical protein
MKRWLQAAAAAVLAALVAWLLWPANAGQVGPDDFVEPRQTLRQGMQSIGDVVRFQGRYVAADLLANRLVVFDDLALDEPRYFEPASIGQRLYAPHFLAVSPRGTLLISEGWGTSIVEIGDLDGGGWRRFYGKGLRLNAPHGICVDRDGWIYVGDSLNSRLVRFRDMDGTDWQVFADVDKRIAYIRQLRCEDGAVWAANSYENRPGLNPGKGANILKIADFASGRVEEVARIADASITGFAPLGGGHLLVSLWGPHRRLGFGDLATGKITVIPGSALALGIPYGIYRDPNSAALLVAYLGTSDTAHDGGIAVFGVRSP